MVVRMRHTRSHTGNRRSHHALKERPLSTCTNCKALHVPHHACTECGRYRGRVVIDIVKKAEKKAKKSSASTPALPPKAEKSKEAKPEKAEKVKKVAKKEEEVTEKKKK